MLELIARQSGNHHVSMDTVVEFESAIAADKRVRQVRCKNKVVSEFAYYSWRVLNKLGRHVNHVIKPRLLRKICSKDQHDYFVVLMGLELRKCFPYFMFPGRKSVYLFDAWAGAQDLIRGLVDYWEVEQVFLSSSQVAKRLGAFGGDGNYAWVPEGINPELYLHYAYSNKDIDVLQLGRKYDAYHEHIVRALEQDRKVYLYEKVKGEIIFPTRKGFIDGLARTKISICVPSNITHPERAGDVETMTIRYLQSMVSKCLILGHAPQEMIGLFGYNPVVEIDMRDPLKQIQSLLNNFADYLPLIEKNYLAVVEHHTWHHRWQRIASVLFPET